MTSPFTPVPPCRVRFESAGHSFDSIVPCAIIAIPSADGSQVSIVEHHQSREQLVTLTSALIKQASAAGILGNAMSIAISGGASLISHQGFQTPPPGAVPPDDVPPHLRSKP